jgi:serine protease Do
LPAASGQSKQGLAMRFKSTLAFVLTVVALGTQSTFAAEDRDLKVQTDRREVQQIGGWLYNDLPAAITKARDERKPMLVVLRCIP